MPPILPPQPIVIQGEGNKAFNQIYCTDIQISSPAINGAFAEIHARITVIPYNNETGEIAPISFQRSFEIPSVTQLMLDGDTDAYQAFEAITAFVKNKIPNLWENV